MLQKTRGIVLRSVKYGETSLVTTVFTEYYGLQSYMLQGVRSIKAKTNRAGLLQPLSLLEMLVYHIPNRSLQRIKEFQPAYIYTNLHEEVIKNSIGLFCVELLTKLLPQHAIIPELFEFVFDYFCRLDKMKTEDVANFPLFFMINCSRLLGYDIRGSYSGETPHLHLEEGSFSVSTPSVMPYVQEEDARIFSNLLKIKEAEQLKNIEMNAAMRFRLLDWYIIFLQRHTQHMGSIRSLSILHEILH